MLQIFNLHVQISSDATANATLDLDLHWADNESKINQNSISLEMKVYKRL